jgi:sigma-E factor negative regulatory protein RseC
MLEESAIVVKTTDHEIWVAGENSGCAGCAQKSGCSTAVVSKLLKNKPVLVSSPIPLTVGDRVVVGIDESILLRAAFSLYFLPLIALFIGAGLADSLISKNVFYADIGIAVSALTSLGLTLWAVRQRKDTASPQPVVLKKY